MKSLMFTRQAHGTPPIALEKDHPSIPEALRTKIQEGTACVLRDVNREHPLRAGEAVQSDSFSYLTQPYASCPEDTVVLTRKTNLEEFYFIFPDVKLNRLHDAASGLTMIQVQDGARPLYPVPPPVGVEPKMRLTAATGSSYSITGLKVKSASQIEFSWSVTDEPSKNDIWWGVYQGVMPSWKNLGQYSGWNWVCPKGSNYGKTGTQTVSVSLSSGVIYTFALFKSKWELGDYQQFTAP